jgi:dihydropteroate synthase
MQGNGPWFCSGHLLSIQQGACMVRAHDVKAMMMRLKFESDAARLNNDL